MLAYYLLLSVVPVLVMLASIFGIVLGLLDPQTRHNLVSTLVERIPGTQEFLPLALAQLRRHSGAFAVVSVLTSAYFGSRLFKNIDYCFGIIFRLPPRSLMPEQLMALKMLLFFIVAVPVLVVISTIPGFVSKQSVAQALLGDSGVLAFGVAVLSMLTGLLVASVFFALVYVVVPNRHVPLRLVWKGAVVAGTLLEIYQLTLPIYAARYLDGQNDTVTAGFTLVVVIFFYYFGLVLLLGAELNAFLLDRGHPARSESTRPMQEPPVLQQPLRTG